MATIQAYNTSGQDSDLFSVTCTNSGTKVLLDANIVQGNVAISGNIIIGSVSATVDSIYIQSGANMTGSMYVPEVEPTAIIKNNPHYTFEYIISGTATGITGSEIGSVIQFIGAGSYVKVLTYLNDNLINIGSWS